MRWEDEGIVIYRKASSEKGAVIGLLTQEHGRWNGWFSGKNTPQLGECVHATWSSRLEDHLGSWKFESAKGTNLAGGDRLMALSSLCQLCHQSLPERHSYPLLFQAALNFIEGEEDWRTAYILFELTLLRELGFGLSLRTCAVTQGTNELAYVSPKTGRAVCREAGLPYQNQLLSLPEFLSQNKWPTITQAMFEEALQLTGYFIGQHVCHNRLPPLRKILAP